MQLLTTIEAAKRLSLAPQTLRHWHSQGKGPKVTKLGRSVRYKVADLDAWVERGGDERP